MLAKRLSPLPKRVPLRTSLAMTVRLHDQIVCHIFCASSFAIFPFGFPWWKSISQVHLTNCKLTFCHLISILHSWSVFVVPLVFFSGWSRLHYRKLNLNGRLLQTTKILRPLGELNEKKIWFSRPVTGLWLASDRSVKRWRKLSIPTTERDE